MKVFILSYSSNCVDYGCPHIGEYCASLYIYIEYIIIFLLLCISYNTKKNNVKIND